MWYHPTDSQEMAGQSFFKVTDLNGSAFHIPNLCNTNYCVFAVLIYICSSLFSYQTTLWMS